RQAALQRSLRGLRLIALEERLHDAVDLLERALEQAGDDRVLGAEVEVERRARDAGALDDLLDAELVQRRLGEQLLAGLEDRVPGCWGVGHPRHHPIARYTS